MKVYTLEFEFFDAVQWKDTHIEIVATSIIQLVKSFITETNCILNKKNVTIKEIRKSLWKSVKKNIIEDDFQFPLVKKVHLD
jgi:hypothetical protein